MEFIALFWDCRKIPFVICDVNVLLLEQMQNNLEISQEKYIKYRSFF